MPDVLTPEQKIDDLARNAAARAAHLATVEAERVTKDAVARAVRDANIDRDLLEHQRHLEAINGSQSSMAASLTTVEKTLSELSSTFMLQVKVQETLADTVEKQSAQRLSRRAFWLTALGVLAAYGSLLVLLIINVH